MDRYNVVCFYQDSSRRRRTMERNVSLETAQRMCNDPETSSRTCTSSTGKARTRRSGPWFYGYERA